MRTHQTSGYSLLELLTSLTLLGMLAVIGTPALSIWLDSQRLHSLQIDLLHATNKARYLAMSSQQRVTLCPLSEQGNCRPNWSESISTFIDRNGNRRLDPGEDVVSRLYIHDSISLYWRGMLPKNSIHFSNQGVTFVSNGTMSLCSEKVGAKTGTMTISRQGRVKISSDNAQCP